MLDYKFSQMLLHIGTGPAGVYAAADSVLALGSVQVGCLAAVVAMRGY